MADHDGDLRVVSVRIAPEDLQPSDGGLPAKYPVYIGLSRRLKAWEGPQAVEVSNGRLQTTNDLLWLAFVDTTIEEVKASLFEIDQYLARAVEGASAMRQAHEALDEAGRFELDRRKQLEREINENLSRQGDG